MRAEAIEDSYELSPMQQGMLYHSLESPDSGIYVIQVVYTLSGSLESSAFRTAWQKVVDRHAPLRTSFHWKDRAEPYQVVHPRVELPFDDLDWRELDASEQARRLSEMIDARARQGFALDQAPLLRVGLIRTRDREHRLVLSHHHLLLDGWCKPILFDEVFAFYRATLAGGTPELSEPPSYRRYLEWLRERDLARAERFWRKELSGVSQPTPVLPDARVGEPASREYDEVAVELEEPAMISLRDFARSQRLTLNTLVLGAWALVLGVSSDRADVVFGATVNGRPADLAGADSMIGLFINTLPVRVRFAASDRLVELLATLQIRQAMARDFDFTPLGHIQRWTSMSGKSRLFESIVVFENNPGFGCDVERYGDIAISDVKATIRNSLPLTLRCVPGTRLGFQLLYDARRFPRSAIETTAGQVTELLSGLASDPGASVGDAFGLLRRVAARDQQRTAAAYDNAVLNRLRTVASGKRR